jgi:PAS domain S-box-containing protein
MTDPTQIPFLVEIIVSSVTALVTAVALAVKNHKSHKAITKQLEKNGGTSLVDKVQQILNKLDSISLQLHRVETWKTAWMELTEEPIFVTDISGNYIWVNNAYSHLVGLTAEDLLGLGWSKALHPEDKENVIEEWKSSISSMSKFEYTYRVVNYYSKDIAQIKTIAKPLKEQSGSLVGYIGIIYIEKNEEEAKPQ